MPRWRPPSLAYVKRCLTKSRSVAVLASSPGDDLTRVISFTAQSLDEPQVARTVDGRVTGGDVQFPIDRSQV
jgi:hypothetical protein